jgi:hypothetical protein
MKQQSASGHLEGRSAQTGLDLHDIHEDEVKEAFGRRRRFDIQELLGGRG